MSAPLRQLFWLALAELLAMALWFSASAVVPQLAVAWGLDGAQQSWLTMSVQLGFVIGAVGSAAVNLADRVRADRLFAVSAVVGAVANAAIAAVEPPFAGVVALRFVTGAALAGVYPPGMKLMVSWFSGRRGTAIGVLVGALTVGSALPHLLNALPLFPGPAGLPPWRWVLGAASASAVLAAALVLAAVRPGPHLAPAPRLDWRQAARALTDTALRRANFGYLGHMWELYAMWAWVPLFLLESYRQAGLGDAAARAAGFLTVAVGGIGCVAAGVMADRWGRSRVAILSMTVSGACALVAGQLAATPWLLTALCLVWGLAVVADSAQFSAAVSELADQEYVGTALTVQTSLGFLLTLVTIRLVPPLVELGGWSLALATLAVGPAFGIFHMARLRQMPEASRLAGGRG